MSGYYLLEHLVIAAFGNGIAVVRFPSVIAAVATVALIGAIALHLFGYRAAFAAGLLAAVSLPLVFWAQSARGYALMVAFVAAAYLVLITIVTRSAQLAPGAAPRTDRRAWVAFVVLMALATYSSFVAVLVIPAQLLALAPRRRRAHVRPFMFAFVAYALLCVPLFVLAVRRGSGQLFWVPRPTHKIEVQVLQELTSAGLQPSFHRTATTTPLLIATVAALIAIAVWAGRRWRQRESAWGLGVALAWLVVPVAITFVYSLVAQPLFPAAQCPDGGARGSAAAGGRARASRPAEVRRPGGARGARGAAGAAARCQLRRLARALAAGHRVRPGPRPTGRLHRLLPARRADGVPVLPRHRSGRRCPRSSVDPSARALGHGHAVRRGVRNPVVRADRAAARRAAGDSGS